MAAHAARRLMPMTDNVATIIAIELMAAAQACHFHEPLMTSTPLQAVIKLLRQHVPVLDEDQFLHPHIKSATALVTSGSIVNAAGVDLLPAICD